MSGNAEVELIHRTWEAMSRGDLAALHTVLAPDARWRAVYDAPPSCENRAEIIDTITRNMAGGLRGHVEEAIEAGDRVVVAFRSAAPVEQLGPPLEAGLAYLVVTIHDGLIVELKGCADRASAMTYAETGVASEARTGVGPPVGTVGQRVSNLIPFARVGNVQRSIDFYAHLGFVAESVHAEKNEPTWASLESDGAELMLEATSDPIDASRQRVLFYLYSEDLEALRHQLIAGGIAAGEIEDGSPGPLKEMRVIDPDGYELMVAQID